ncbi:MAG: cysteine hydrolase [Clostridiaceae bacterium]|nr:cysteine hydrolase [Clostridiaceae bacterium]
MTKLLIVVDYQKDFVDGALGFPGAERLHEPICAKIEEYKRNQDVVVFTKDTHHTEYLSTREGRHLPVVHCVRGTMGHELYGRLEELSRGCMVFEKYTFGSDILFDYLRSSGFSEIELVGLVSNICVLSNAILAQTALPEAMITVNASLTDSYDKDLNAKTLDVLEGLQVRVIRTDETGA